jgi:cob(I)alamin adenosyltransferase
MSGKRQSYEAGHKRKYLVIIDESPECAARSITRAAARRAELPGWGVAAVEARASVLGVAVAAEVVAIE